MTTAGNSRYFIIVNYVTPEPFQPQSSFHLCSTHRAINVWVSWGWESTTPRDMGFACADDNSFTI
jgi:hypothetical protein